MLTLNHVIFLILFASSTTNTYAESLSEAVEKMLAKSPDKGENVV